MKKINFLKLYIYTCLIIVLEIIDYTSKQAMYLMSNQVQGYTIKLFKSDFLLFTYVENHGGIFGVFQGHIRVFTVLSIIFIIFLIYYEFDSVKKLGNVGQVGVCFLIAGAIGNMYDRLFRGYVIDMINFHYIWRFVFNIADMYIHIGIYLLIIDYLIKIYKEKR